MELEHLNNKFRHRRATRCIQMFRNLFIKKFRFTRMHAMNFSQKVNDRWYLEDAIVILGIISKCKSSYRSTKKVIGNLKQPRNVFLSLRLSFQAEILESTGP